MAVWATRSRGDTAEIGLQLRAATQAHLAVATERQKQSARMASDLVVPLGKRLKSNSKVIGVSRCLVAPIFFRRAV